MSQLRLKGCRYTILMRETDPRGARLGNREQDAARLRTAPGGEPRRNPERHGRLLLRACGQKGYERIQRLMDPAPGLGHERLELKVDSHIALARLAQVAA
jgi:hypothetical protein